MNEMRSLATFNNNDRGISNAQDQKNILSVFHTQQPNGCEIMEDMNPETLAKIVSDRLIQIVKEDFQKVTGA